MIWKLKTWMEAAEGRPPPMFLGGSRRPAPKIMLYMNPRIARKTDSTQTPTLAPVVPGVSAGCPLGAPWGASPGAPLGTPGCPPGSPGVYPGGSPLGPRFPRWGRSGRSPGGTPGEASWVVFGSAPGWRTPGQPFQSALNDSSEAIAVANFVGGPLWWIGDVLGGSPPVESSGEVSGRDPLEEYSE
jgi:hypothetical protein